MGRAGVRTFTYDGGTERRGLLTQVTDTQAGTMTGTYDAGGRLVTEAWPNGINVAMRYAEDGMLDGIAYEQPGCGQSTCTLYTESAGRSAHGQIRGLTSSPPSVTSTTPSTAPAPPGSRCSTPPPTAPP
nr:hypothetical protein GCM10020063_040580 [Dactylosporangium thailandense]